MKSIITGITGQDGSHLADLLLSKGYEVVGVSRRSSTDNTYRIKHILSHPRFKLIEGDITDMSSINHIFKSNANVDEIYNLAAQSHVGTSFKQPRLTWDITGKGCINLLQTIVDLDLLHIRFYQASSSEMFGASYDVNDYGEKYQDENTKFLPQSPYAIAKCAAHYAVRMYREAYNLHASTGILFNHEGPRRGDNFVTKKIINWICKFRRWMEFHNVSENDINTSETNIHCNFDSEPLEKLRLGNLDAYRDWGFAGDYVEAMWLMLQQEAGDDYVICTGKSYSVRDFLNIAFKFAGINSWENYVYIDPEFYRPAEVDFLKGSAYKANIKLGWHPKHNLEDLIRLMFKNEKFQSHTRSV